MNNILVIGIAGGTGSGKTTLMNNLIETFKDDVTLLSHDNYYKRHDDLTYEERCGLNYDEPGAFDNLTARAMDTLAGIIEVGGHLLRPGGQLLAMKGVHPHEEIAQLPADWQVLKVHPLQVPGLVGDRHLVVVGRR